LIFSLLYWKRCLYLWMYLGEVEPANIWSLCCLASLKLPLRTDVLTSESVKSWVIWVSSTPIEAIVWTKLVIYMFLAHPKVQTAGRQWRIWVDRTGVAQAVLTPAWCNGFWYGTNDIYHSVGVDLAGAMWNVINTRHAAASMISRLI
jgi:hypothetical protein